MKLTGLALLIIMSLLVMGCDQDQSVNSENESTPPKLLHWYSSGVPEGLDLPTDRTLAERKEAMEAFKEASQAFATLQNASNWKSADRQARDLIDAFPDVPLYSRQQLAADRMLKHWLLDAKPTPETQEALSFYTGLLVDNRSPQAQIVAPALTKLRGTWSDARISVSADVVAQAARQHLEKRGITPDDRITEAMAKNAGPDGERVLSNSHNRHHYGLLLGISDLEAMRGNQG